MLKIINIKSNSNLHKINKKIKLCNLKIKVLMMLYCWKSIFNNQIKIIIYFNKNKYHNNKFSSSNHISSNSL
jgi:hypothetical protein